MDKDPPIEAPGFTCGVNIIDFGELRISRGLSRRPFSMCRHINMVYDSNERRIWCKDCESNVEAFDAFTGLVENIQIAYDRVNKDRELVNEAKSHNLHLLATKNIEKAWRGRTVAIQCPHCRGGLLPEDFLSPYLEGISAEIERKRREKEKQRG